MTPQHATLTAWGVWLVSWTIAAFWADRAEKRPVRGEEWFYRVLTFFGGYLLLYRSAMPGRWTGYQLWELGLTGDWAMFVAALAGFAFAWWARLYLGRLWSSSVTKKADHRVIDSGPYGLVRHPIYTGLLLSAAATAAGVGTGRAIAGFLLFLGGFWIKARLEERFLGEQLGSGAYEAYRRRVPMLLPFGPTG